MRIRLRKNPGWTISFVGHALLLAAVLLGFSRASEVVDPREAIPVELVDARALGEVVKGEKAAPAVKPRPRAEKRADLAEPKPLPALADAVKDVTPPPAPAKRQPDPGQDVAKEETKPAPKAAEVTPPPRPEPKPRPVKQSMAEAPKAPAKPPQPEDAEPLEPKPKTAQKPEPTKPEPTKPEPKKPEPKKPERRNEPDRLAKLLEQDKSNTPTETPAAKPVAKPRSGDDSASPDKKFDPSDITKFLSKETPQRKAATGQELQQLASLGAPNASAARMSPSLWDQLDGLLQEQYKRCWTFIGLGGQRKYVPEIRVQFAADGSLTQAPELLNPPSDPNLKPLADSAIRAVRRCDPLRIPARYQPYYEQWKGRIVRFDPEEML